jgi:hypothetical protein
MTAFLESVKNLLTGATPFYWGLAIFGSLIFIILFIMTLFGFGDHSTDIDGDGEVTFGEHADTGFGDFKLFSFRAIVAFITFFGWGGILWGKNGWGGFFGACALGFGMMFVTACIFFFVLKLQHTGNITAKDILGATGTVYLAIPAGRIGTGKVTVSLKECTRQIVAVADEEIPSGASVKIEEMVDGTRYLVRKV